MRRLAAALALLAAAGAAVAQAGGGDGLDPARRAGQVGENWDGYATLVAPGASDTLRRQVAAVNIKRRTLYYQLARQRGVPAEGVAQIAACSIFSVLKPGDYYRLSDGAWRRVPAGADGVRPDYCG